MYTLEVYANIMKYLIYIRGDSKFHFKFYLEIPSKNIYVESNIKLYIKLCEKTYV